jgi:hypothetical protein
MGFIFMLMQCYIPKIKPTNVKIWDSFHNMKFEDHFKDVGLYCYKSVNLNPCQINYDSKYHGVSLH